MKDLVISVYAFGLAYAQKLVADVPDEQMCAQPVPGRVLNHAAFLLGHLIWAEDFRAGVARPQAGAGAPSRANRSLWATRRATIARNTRRRNARQNAQGISRSPGGGLCRSDARAAGPTGSRAFTRAFCHRGHRRFGADDVAPLAAPRATLRLAPGVRAAERLLGHIRSRFYTRVISTVGRISAGALHAVGCYRFHLPDTADDRGASAVCGWRWPLFGQLTAGILFHRCHRHTTFGTCTSSR